jgi:hypothetical protein
MVNIKGLTKAEVLAALHNASHAQGMGFLHDIGRNITVKECEQELSEVKPGERIYFDYFHGRVIKCNITGDEFSESLFDRDNFPGAAEKAIATIR